MRVAAYAPIEEKFIQLLILPYPVILDLGVVTALSCYHERSNLIKYVVCLVLTSLSFFQNFRRNFQTLFFPDRYHETVQFKSAHLSDAFLLL